MSSTYYYMMWNMMQYALAVYQYTMYMQCAVLLTEVVHVHALLLALASTTSTSWMEGYQYAVLLATPTTCSMYMYITNKQCEYVVSTSTLTPDLCMQRPSTSYIAMQMQYSIYKDMLSTRALSSCAWACYCIALHIRIAEYLYLLHVPMDVPMVSLHGMHIPCVVEHMQYVYMSTTITSIAQHVSMKYYYQYYYMQQY